MRSNVWFILRLAVGFGLLAGLLLFVNFEQLLGAAFEADAGLALSGLCVFLGMGLLEGLRLQLCFYRFGLRMDEALGLHFAGVFFANFLLGNAGSEFFKGWYLRRMHGALAVPIALMALLRILSFAAIAVLMLVYAVVRAGSDELLPGIGVISLSDNVVGLIVSGVIAALIAGWMLDRYMLGGRLVILGGRMWSGIRELSRAAFLSVVVLSFAVNIVRAMAFMLAANAVGIDANLLDSFILIGVAVLATSLPISFSGLGVREGALSGVLMLLSASAPQALSAALLLRIYMLVTALVGWVCQAVLVKRLGSASTHLNEKV